ncbi:unnamed protein product [Brassica oleracea]
MLTKVHMRLPDLIAVVLALDETALDLDQIDNLIKFCPTNEEMEILKVLPLCSISYLCYFLDLMKVPRVESKLRVFSYKKRFGPKIIEFKKRLNTVISACEDVLTSQKLKEVMKETMYLGNTLNQETASDDAAVGFKLDSFLRLSDTFAPNSNMSLMHYLCKDLASKAPVLLDFHKDLESLESASKIRLKSLADEMQAINKGLNKLEQEFIASESDGPVSEVFCKTLKEFIPIADNELKKLLRLSLLAAKNVDALLVYFGEDLSLCLYEQVTRTLLSFIRSFKKAQEENIKQE